MAVMGGPLGGRQGISAEPGVAGDSTTVQPGRHGPLYLEVPGGERHPVWPHRAAMSSAVRTRAMMVTADLAAIVIGAAVAVVATGSPWSRPVLLVYAAGILPVMVVSGAYRVRITLRILDEVPAHIRRVAIPLLPLLPGFSWVASLQIVMWQLVGTVLAIAVGRASVYALVRRMRRRGRLAEATLIVGAGDVGTQLAMILREHRDLGLVPIGFVDTYPPESDELPLPLLGPMSSLEDIVQASGAGRVLIAFGKERDADWVTVLRTAVATGIGLHVVPRLFDIGNASLGKKSDEIRGVPLHEVRRSALRTTSWRVKRTFDLAVAGLALALFSPVFGVVALAIRVSGPGPVLFKQLRLGQDGRKFWLLKFRTMDTGHDGETIWSAAGHADITTVGRWLRRASLDEIPQLWNILRGEMSLVGPRPERPYFAERFDSAIPGYGDRHRLPAGLTGLAQVNGLRGADSSIVERARYDNLYIEHWSLWLDIKILLWTFSQVMLGARESR